MKKTSFKKDFDSKPEILDSICNKLTERNTVLFLGAGINSGCVNKKGKKFPLAKGLGEEISTEILEESDLSLNLDQLAEMAQYKIGEEGFNRYLFEKFESFLPDNSHNLVVELPWDVIYTTNYDLLIEKASKNNKNSIGEIKQVFSSNADLTQFDEKDILYYKLHGSVDKANTEEGRIIITKKDYRTYEKKREKLFSRLKKDLMNRTFVFIGYSLEDSNFLSILDDCREELGVESFPLSYVVKPNVTETEKIFWKEKYNIEVIKGEALNFLTDLHRVWNSGGYKVISFEERKAKKYLNIDDSASFPKIGGNYYGLNPSDCTGVSNPERFYKGGEPFWADARDKIYPQRDAYDELFEIIFPELSDVKKSIGIYLITGHAGTGKTSLIKSLTYDLAKDFNVPVFVHIHNTPLDPTIFSSIFDKESPKRIVLVISHAANYAGSLKDFLIESERLNLPLTILLEERKNQWNVAQESLSKKLPNIHQVHLADISEKEINQTLDSLTEHNLLGKLSGIDRVKQVEYFKSVSDKELLVALRELTLDQSFDDIIKDEFSKISDATARDAYLYVSALGQIDVPIRYETLVRILGISYEDLRVKVFYPTEGVLISGEVVGNSRHNEGFNLNTRHPVIASIIFSVATQNDDRKFEVINKILSNLDPGFPDDRKLLIDITRKRELVRTFVSPEKSRAVYERLSVILPDDPYVYQHRALLEKELDNPVKALEYAKKSLSYDCSDNPLFKNTYGNILVFVASKSEKHRDRLIVEAEKIFENEIKREPINPYGYLGKVNILKLKIRDVATQEEDIVIKAQLRSLLEESYEVTFESNEIASELAKNKKNSGNLKDALGLLNRGLESDPTNDRLRDALIRMKQDDGDYSGALKLATEGTKYDSTSWRLYRHIARSQRKLGSSPIGIKGNYEAAIRHNKGDIKLLVELAAYLFILGNQPEANKIFNEANQMPISSRDRYRIMEWWLDENISRKTFNGIIDLAEGGGGYILAIPENFKVYFNRSRDLFRFKQGDKVNFYIGFNAKGPVAKIID